jgi:hypothetical protein
MAGLRVFVSSTCYDLTSIRSQLRLFIASLGHEPVMSDFNDILYDPRVHTHTSCIEEVAGCDVVVLLVGSRFGGSAIPDALAKVDLDSLFKESRSVDVLKGRENISVTQLEVLKALEQGIPVFSFIEDRVWHDHALYEKNKGKPIIDQIEFPSIQRKDTAGFIFEFINFLRLRVRNNSVFAFSKTQDIEETLRRQWSGLMQRLINEQRRRNLETARIDNLSTQLADLRAAILTTIESSDQRKIAQGVVRFRRLVEFLRGLKLDSWDIVFSTPPPSWQALMRFVGVEDVLELPDNFVFNGRFGRGRCFLVKHDTTFYECRIPREILDELQLDWHAFMQYSPESRHVIIEALREMPIGIPSLRYIQKPFDMYYKQIIMEPELAQEKVESEGEN